MAAVTLSTALIAIGTAAAVGGAVVGYQGQQQAIDAQEKQDAVRADAAKLEADRRKRAILRQNAQARAASLSQATVQGASGAGGSGLPGAQGQITNSAAENMQGVNISQQQSQAMFGLQQDVNAGYRTAALGGTITSIGQGVSNLGGALNKLPSQGSSGAYTGPQRPITINEPWGTYQW